MTFARQMSYEKKIVVGGKQTLSLGIGSPAFSFTRSGNLLCSNILRPVVQKRQDNSHQSLQGSGHQDIGGDDKLVGEVWQVGLLATLSDVNMQVDRWLVFTL